MASHQTVYKVFEIENFRLQSGVVMPRVQIAYRTEGHLAEHKENVVLITHGNTSGPSMLDSDSSTGEGTWSTVVGPGKAIDTNRFFVVCPNMLGSSYGSTNAASIDPATGKPYGSRFPDITVKDIVATQRLLLNHLGIDKLMAVAGPSYGGFQAFQWAVDYPHDMQAIVAVVTSPFVPRFMARSNVRKLNNTLSENPNWNGGDYYATSGLTETLRQIRVQTLKSYGMVEQLRKTTSDQKQIEQTIQTSAERWAHEFDANSLLILAKALVGFNTVPHFRHIRAKVLYVLSSTDKIFKSMYGLPVLGALRFSHVDAQYFKIDSDCGHLASGGKEASRWTPRLRQFMDSLF